MLNSIQPVTNQKRYLMRARRGTRISTRTIAFNSNATLKSAVSIAHIIRRAMFALPVSCNKLIHFGILFPKDQLYDRENGRGGREKEARGSGGRLGRSGNTGQAGREAEHDHQGNATERSC